MKRGLIVVLCIGIVIVLSFLGASLYIQWNKLTEIQTSNELPIPINYSNFEREVARQSFVADLPEEGTILLTFYTFNIGERVLENSYVLRKGVVVKETIAAPDITILLHSKYLDSLTNQNFCEIIGQAQENGDLSIENQLSKTAFAWKYRGMLKYKSCLGM